ncbi:SLC13 family permease [Rhodohalobacter sp. 614A]|uniref:SLC13 family permease n=1 Tax=Rhodohalobacter sp. 614A TaxID=2908649 RepID=UPI001F1FF807|nr:SLC13 family permease [Rhodohalobacter sp. 614A]
MEPTGLFVLVLVLIALVLLVIKNYPADAVFIGLLTVIVVSGIVTPAQALVGFSNEGMLTIGALYVVATGLRETGGVQVIVKRLLGTPRQLWRVQAKIFGPVLALSAFLNNTPIVATFIPALQEWGGKFRVPVSKLLIPLSYAAILGGTCTLIGTSTNLIINGLLLSEVGIPLGMFEPAYVGIPVAVVGFIYMMTVGRQLLPDTQSALATFEDTRKYTIEMIVGDESPLIGQSIEQAGLRQLPGLFVAEVVRDGTILAAVEPDEVLEKDDRIIFTGLVDSIVDLQRIQGLIPATTQVFKLETPRRERHLVEAVVSPSNPLNGKTIKEGKFRNQFGAVVLAVSRRGERINKKVGEIRLRTGDILLLETPRDFSERYKYSSDFLLVSTLSQKRAPNYKKSWIAWIILGGMVTLVTANILTMLQGSFLAAALMIVFGCTHVTEARNSIDWQVLLVIAAALGIGNALQITGIAQNLAGSFIGLAGNNPYMALISVYFLTWILTEILTNNAAAVLVFPFAMSVAANLDVHYMPFVMTALFAASASFSTPIGYQTNLMVYAAGGYKFRDFIKVGLPLNLLVAIIIILLVPIIWPF